jgi:hypothetical protein
VHALRALERDSRDSREPAIPILLGHAQFLVNCHASFAALPDAPSAGAPFSSQWTLSALHEVADKASLDLAQVS